MKKLWTALLSAILCCSLAFGAVSVCAETGGDTNVVPVLTREITQADWDSAEKYEMTAVSEGTSGATGTVSFLATGTRLYFLMQVQDATKFDSDRPDYTITIGGKTASARQILGFAFRRSLDGGQEYRFRAADQDEFCLYRRRVQFGSGV